MLSSRWPSLYLYDLLLGGDWNLFHHLFFPFNLLIFIIQFIAAVLVGNNLSKVIIFQTDDERFVIICP